MAQIAAVLGKQVGRRPAAALAGAATLLILGGAIYILAGEKRPAAYSLAEVRAGAAQVPRDFLAGLPTAALRDAQFAARKDIFVRTLLPLILRSNEAIQADRARLLDLFERRDSGEPLSRKERAWLSRLANRYGRPAGGLLGDLPALARRVDVIPPSLALTQAAVESAWGTSRFALEGNALYGVRTFRQAPALVPDERDGNSSFAVRRYARLADSVRAYMHTLNTHAAYREFRGVREESRANGPIDARSLLPTLERYAEDSGYRKLLDVVMRDGRFWEFDQASFKER